MNHSNLKCYCNNVNLKKLFFQIQLIVFMLLMNIVAIAQNNIANRNLEIQPAKNQISKVISFGEKIYLGVVENDVNWNIINISEKINISLKGNQINEYQFEKPGIYQINFIDSKANHSHDDYHPAFDEKMLIEVSPVKMIFDFTKIEFSEKIIKNKNHENVIVTVPVLVSIYDNSTKLFTIKNSSVAGIGVDLSITPVSKSIELKNGIQNIQYKITGKVNNETYLMYDFIDFNNQVQTYSQTQIIN